MQLSGTIAFVTGANRGLGQSFVRGLLDAGAAKVYAGARDVGQLDATVALDPARVVPVQIDVTDRASISAAAQTAGDTRLFINNAGVLSFGGALEIDRAALEHDLSVNYFGLIDATRGFAPVIERNGGGTVANVLTLLSFVAAPGFSGYNASKAAAWSMTMSLRAYLAPKGVMVVNTFPAGIDTDMLKGVDAAKDSPATVAADTLKGIEAGVEDVYPGSAAGVFDAWRSDPKAIEKAFAGMM